MCHSPEINFMKRVNKLDLQDVFTDYAFEITAMFPRGQWLNNMAKIKQWQSNMKETQLLLNCVIILGVHSI